MLSEKRDAARENCCGSGKLDEGSEDDDKDEGGVGSGELSSCAEATGDALGGGEGGIRGVSYDGGGVVEAEDEQLSCAEDGDDVTAGDTL